MDIKVLGIDLGKTVCSLAGLDEAGAVVFRKRLQRHHLLDFLHDLPPCVVAMEPVAARITSGGSVSNMATNQPTDSPNHRREVRSQVSLVTRAGLRFPELPRSWLRFLLAGCSRSA